jgi:hypothetical protein
VLKESIVTHFHIGLWLHNVYCGFEYRFRFNKVRFLQIRPLPVINKDCFTCLALWLNRRIIVGFFIKLSDSVLKSTESLNKSKGAVNTHINASSDGHSFTSIVAILELLVCCYFVYDPLVVEFRCFWLHRPMSSPRRGPSHLDITSCVDRK